MTSIVIVVMLSGVQGAYLTDENINGKHVAFCHSNNWIHWDDHVPVPRHKAVVTAIQYLYKIRNNS